MVKYNLEELKLLNIQIGCVLRLERLRKGLSQEDLAVLLDSNSTMIGRIERSKNESGWSKIFLISQELEINYCDLFVLMRKDELLAIVEQSLVLESKLTAEKERYFIKLKIEIVNQYDKLK